MVTRKFLINYLIFFNYICSTFFSQPKPFIFSSVNTFSNHFS
jgi:hypothetical protein